MSEHLRFGANSPTKLTEPTVGERTLPPRKYYGFMIGSESEHDKVAILIPGQSPLLCEVGRPVICEYSGSVEVQTLRYLPLSYPAHVIGLTCPGELAAACAKRPSGHHEDSLLGSEGAGTTFVIPFSGRRHAQAIIVADGAAITYHIYGRKTYNGYDLGGHRDVDLSGSDQATVDGEAIGVNVGEPAIRPEYFQELLIAVAGLGGSDEVTLYVDTFDD